MCPAAVTRGEVHTIAGRPLVAESGLDKVQAWLGCHVRAQKERGKNKAEAGVLPQLPTPMSRALVCPCLAARALLAVRCCPLEELAVPAMAARRDSRGWIRIPSKRLA
jgi:hypothetical protein